MPAESSLDVKFEIGHVLFIDIVNAAAAAPHANGLLHFRSTTQNQSRVGPDPQRSWIPTASCWQGTNWT